MSIHIKTALLGMLLAFSVGCTVTEPARFYNLTTIIESGLESAENAGLQDISIGVGPISIPDYLDRPQIVTGGGQNEVHMSEYDRWAGSLKDGIGVVLSENLSVLLPTDRIFIFPWRGSLPIDYQIEIEVVRFDGELGKGAFLTARWIIYDVDTRQVAVVKKSSFMEPVSEPGYKAMVAAQSRTLARISRDMAAVIKALLRDRAYQ